ncbi:MAG: SpoIIE family protein phosphatase [Candidatus Krumholzibacteriota bacterium]|nr:SpoIIE family protein phosphatase [Candidatus Krumholzibacteriota bacterium]
MTNKILSRLVIILGFLLLAISLLFYTQETLRTLNWKSTGNMESDISLGPDYEMVFSRIDTLDFASSPYPARGDTLIQLADSLATLTFLLEELHTHHPGYEIPLAYRHGDDTLRTVVVAREVTSFDFISMAVLHLLRVLTGLLFIGVGLWANVRRPESGAVRALAMFCFSMAALMAAAINMGIHSVETFEIPYVEFIQRILRWPVLFVGAFWLNLQLLFPQPRKFVKNHPLSAYLLCYLLPFLVLIVSFLHYLLIFAIVTPAMIVLQLLAGFILLGTYNRSTRDNLQRRQTRLVLWGTGSGLSGMVIFILLATLARGWLSRQSETLVMGIIILVFLGLLLSPLSFAYAFGRYRLLEVEGKIKRGTRYAVVTVFLLAAFFALVFFISEALLSRVNVGSRALLPTATLLMAIGFTPAQRRIQNLLERKIYPERSRLKQMLKDFLSSALVISEKHAFWIGLEGQFREALKVELVYPVLRVKAQESLQHWSGEDTPFERESPFSQALFGLQNRPLMVDEILAGDKIAIAPPERKWLTDKKIALVLPLVSRGKLIGFLALGHKTDRNDFESADIELLGSLSFQVAMASENIVLLEENLEKQRMEDELNMARTVQEGLLPRVIPQTPGLEVAGKSESCLEIAGDYYDVINLDDRRTVLAIGDVSGKGAGAALLMSNLQASIRTAVRIGSDLKTIVGQINDLIFHNTQAHQFITFFVGIFDKRSMTFSYVNAGHNPPLVIGRDGRITRLVCGGLILGAMAEIAYQLDTVKLPGGDLIFLYTDGLSEAINPREEMFAEAGVERFLLAHRELSPVRLLEELEAEINRFVEGKRLEDDLTLLAVRVLDG